MTNQTHHETDAALKEDSCVFCKIVSGQIPATKVYEDSDTIAFLDLAPVHPGHALVIPKDHFENVYTTPDEAWCRIQLTVKKLSLAVKQAVNADGINLHMNNEKAAGQVVHHAHVHIIPRHNDDGLTHWPGGTYKDDADRDSFAEKIKAEIE